MTIEKEKKKKKKRKTKIQGHGDDQRQNQKQIRHNGKTLLVRKRKASFRILLLCYSSLYI